MKKSGCLVAIIIVVLIPVTLYCWINWDRITAKDENYECPTDYGALEGAWLNLPNDSVANIQIYSVEFVGRFSDKMKGHYSHINDSTLVVQWDWADDDNAVYTNPPYIDTLIIRGENFIKSNVLVSGLK